MIDWAQLLPAFLIGFLGAGHCVGMCGGIMSVLSLNTGKVGIARLILLLNYNLGRITSYTCAGVLLGWLGSDVTDFYMGATALRWIAGALLIAMALYLAGWWKGLVYLEKIGSVFWKKIQPFGKNLMPVDNAFKALLLGGLWGWLPCGLVYSALGLSAAQGSMRGGALVMLAFGLGTLPLLLITGVAAETVHRWLRNQGVRLAMALLVFIAGIWTVWGGLGHAGHDHSGHSSHAGHSSQNSSHNSDSHENHAQHQQTQQHESHHSQSQISGPMTNEAPSDSSSSSEKHHHHQHH